MLITLHDVSFEPWIRFDEIQAAVKRIALQVRKDLPEERITLVCVLKGATLFSADLLREIKGEVELSFVRVHSYSGEQSTGTLNWEYAPKEDWVGKHVLLVEDIVDSGLTLEKLCVKFHEDKVASFRSASLLFKPEAFRGSVKPDYVGIEIPNRFVVGYGLDYMGLGRNLKEVYQKSGA
jgi:hypoxanthine phosphoribosyltransferase